ncbi:MAG: hypothetical protein IAI48_16730 [Candidatus Eremiobacteraeota bacterium]|nr:hypothetical protein [Candidatus Eremiobacteraeota bacterium]
MREAHESAGKLYFVLDRSPFMGYHFLTLYGFAHALTPVRLSFPTQDLQYLEFMDTTANVAILQGIEKRDTRLDHYWKLSDGAFVQITKSEGAAPGSRSPQPHTPATCNFNDGGVRFFAGNGTMEISPIVLSSATHNIANAHGITMGCRRVGTTNLLWLFSDEDAQNGVTFVVEPGRLRPLFVGHPFIQTDHYLVFTHMDDPEGTREYLFVRSE